MVLLYGITSTATSTIIAAIIPTSRRGEGINYYGLSTSLAAAVGPFLGILMLHSLGYDLSSHSVLHLSSFAVLALSS